MLHLAVMLNERAERQNRAFSFALQTLSPPRLSDAGRPTGRTAHPLTASASEVRQAGRALAGDAQGFAQSSFGPWGSALLAADFTYVPARVGHRPGVFHLFRHETDEQVRSVSAFSKGIELFRNLSGAISYELFAQVIAASFPVFVALENGECSSPTM